MHYGNGGKPTAHAVHCGTVLGLTRENLSPVMWMEANTDMRLAKHRKTNKVCSCFLVESKLVESREVRRRMGVTRHGEIQVKGYKASVR